MKKIFSSSLILALMAVAFTGCLKDKGFDNRTYGINDPDTQPPGVGFPLANNAKYTVGLDAGQATLQAVNDVLFINIFGGALPKSDVQVTLTPNDALRTAYNTANGTSILAMPASLYNIPSLTITIPAGSQNGQVPINIPSTVPMDPSNSYGLGFTISAVTGGYVISNNFKNLFVEFTLKNKYDGTYSAEVATRGWCAYGIADDPAYYPWGPAGTATVHMITGGPNSVRFFDDWGFGDFIQVCRTGCPAVTGSSGFGATAPRYYFNVGTNQLIDVDNDAPDDGRGRDFRINPAVNPPAGNYYDPAAKKIYASYIMKQNGRPDQFIDMILTYKGPR